MTEDLESRTRALETAVADLTDKLSRQSQRVSRAVVPPTASEATRGRIYRSEGSPGVSDDLLAVVKKDDDTYDAVSLLGSEGGAAAPADAGYLVTAADGTLTNETVVGATPGGQLGGTWDAPTVDASHSGSSHAGTQAAAEATAAAALAGHTSDTDNPHEVTAAQAGADPTGSADAVQANLDTHEADTSNPHEVTAAQAGAPTTAAFNDHSARHENGGADEISVAGLSGTLADAQTPSAHASSHQNGGGDEVSVAGLSGLLADDQHVLDAEVLAVADALGSAAAVQSNLDDHEADVANPHSVTAAQAGADPAGSAAAVQTALDTEEATTAAHRADTDNPHEVTAAQAGADASGTAASAVSTHAGDADAHHTWPLTDTEIPSGIARDSEVTSAVSTHAGEADPHAGYQLESGKGAANGYAPLDASGLILDSDIPSTIARDSEVPTDLSDLDDTAITTPAENDILQFDGSDWENRDHLALGENPSTAGIVRLPNDQAIAARNAANDADITVVLVNELDNLAIGGNAPTVTLGGLSTDAVASIAPFLPAQGVLDALEDPGTSGQVYTSAGADAAPTWEDAYDDADAVAAMGSKADANALNHDRYEDAEAVAAVEGAVDVADLVSGSATDGHVATADGAGGVAWEAVPGGGAPTDANYLVGTANAGLSNEIVVGTTPGGELGGTWPSPTVDATHSGSTHAAAQAAAEATAAGALSSHAGDPDAHHDEDHAARHSDGGADEVTVEDLATDSTNTSLVLKPDGSGGLAFGAAGGGGAWTPYRAATFSSVSSINLTSLTGYRRYHLLMYFDDVMNSGNYTLRVNGSSSLVYNYGGVKSFDGTLTAVDGENASRIVLMNGADGASNGGMFDISLIHQGGAAAPVMISSVGSAGRTMYDVRGGWRSGNPTSVTAVEVTFAASHDGHYILMGSDQVSV